MAPSIVNTRLFITYSRELQEGIPLYVRSNCFPWKAERFEPAGAAFHAAALRSIGRDVAEDHGGEKPKEEEEFKGAANGFKPIFDRDCNSKGKRKPGWGGDRQDHYSVLGLSNLRCLATEDQIRRSYREAALRHHPDKQGSILLAQRTEKAREAKKREIEEHFKCVQEAYEVLIDPVKRRVYDSTDEFDDEVPCDCAPQDYFRVFGPAFVRNGRWSVSQPVPVLGDDDTPLKIVDEFFDFWYNFKSWREFPHADDFDLDQAESREHKRWMERQNAKLREKARKDESARIRRLVDNAYKRDPRIIRRREEERREKLRRKEAKLQAKRMKEEEAARIVEEERLRKEAVEKTAAEEAAALRRSKEKQKKLLRKERARLRGLLGFTVSNKWLGIVEDDVESLCMSLDIDRMRNLCCGAEQREGLDRARLVKNVLEGRDDCTEAYVPRAGEQKGSLRPGLIDRGVEGNASLEGHFVDNGGKQNGLQSQDSEITVDQGGSLQSESSVTATLELNGSVSVQSIDETMIQNRLLQIPCIEETVEQNGYLQGVCIHGMEEQSVSSQATSLPMVGLGEKVESLMNGGEKEILGNKEEIKLMQKGLREPLEVIADNVWSGQPVEDVSKATLEFTHQRVYDSKVSDSLIVGRKPLNCIQLPQKDREDLEYDSDSGNGNVNVVVSVGIGSGISQQHAGDAEIQCPDKKGLLGGTVQLFSSGDVPKTQPEDEWSANLENALCQALKIFPKEMPQRWDKVAAAVPGKTKAQCMKKFAAMKDNFRTKRK